ncbi:lantibiotic dehydratase [Clostridium sp. C8-1-8]|uniref:lantibiotic dehydratase n=1 Tax=Clostridium sp. C8-1-8 TaxID=2698831 RepID=UPI00136C54AF|nr:lantibiotic dehydratase [Clostridium sp. C8-1-8]
MKENEQYKLLKDFAIRVPAFPINACESFASEDCIEEVLKDNYFKEAIKVASPSLYDSIKKQKFNGSVNNVVMKYYSRISTRTTPFGLFSGVSIGSFDDNTAVSYDDDNFNKRIRVDYEWLVKLIKKIEIDYKGYKAFYLYTSRNICEYGNKIENPVITCFNHYKNNESYKGKCYINNKPNIRFILSILRDGARYDDIQEVFRRKNLKVANSVLDNLLEELIKNEYIYTEIRPKINESSPLDYILERLKTNRFQIEFLQELYKVNLLIKQYNSLKKSEGLALLDEIQNLMANIIENKSYIQVDITNPFKIKLGENIKAEVSELVNFLAHFNGKLHVEDSLSIFKENFGEKYGHYREVPLLEAIDPIYGVGYDEEKGEEEGGKYLNKDILKNNFIKRKIIDAIKNNSDVILYDDDIDEISEKTKAECFPDSMELNLSILAESISEVNSNRYKLKLGANYGSLGAGKSVGRFYDVLKDTSNMYKEIKLEEDTLLSEDFIKCELISLDIDPRSTNVSISNNFRDFQINIANLPVEGEKPNIDINDIYIGLENDALYLKSKKYNKKLIVTTNHMLNTLRSGKICKLLRDISEGCNTVMPFSIINYIYMLDLDYTPRVIYKNTVLISKSWRIRKSDFKEPLSYKNFLKKFYQFKLKYDIPDLLYIRNDDLMLLIDLKIDSFKEILFNEFNKQDRKYIMLQEADLNYTWISNNGQYYANEFVFQVVKNKNLLKDKLLNINNIYPTMSNYKDNKNRIVDNEIRNFGIFNEWIYLKIYHNKSRTKEMLSTKVSALIDVLKKEELISKWFYIQYKDEKHHIRLRLKLNDTEKNYVQVLKILRSFEKNLINDGLAEKLVLDCYEREIERYGGIKVIEHAEDVFEKQSYMALEFLKLTNLSKINTVDEIEFGVMVLISLMDYLGIDYMTQLNIFNTIIDKDFMRKEFSENRKKYIALYNEYIGLTEDNLEKPIGKILVLSIESIKGLGVQVDKVDKEFELTNSKLDILLSLMHMFCNRLYGIDEKKKKKVLAFVRHTLYSVRYFKIKKET